jgi:hypothetical protein
LKELRKKFNNSNIDIYDAGSGFAVHIFMATNLNLAIFFLLMYKKTG